MSIEVLFGVYSKGFASVWLSSNLANCFTNLQFNVISKICGQLQGVCQPWLIQTSSYQRERSLPFQKYFALGHLLMSTQARRKPSFSRTWKWRQYALKRRLPSSNFFPGGGNFAERSKPKFYRTSPSSILVKLRKFGDFNKI